VTCQICNCCLLFQPPHPTHALTHLPHHTQTTPNPPAAQAGALRAASRGLLAALRPEAVALVDAFGFEDYYLNSALGR